MSLRGQVQNDVSLVSYTNTNNQQEDGDDKNIYIVPPKLGPDSTTVAFTNPKSASHVHENGQKKQTEYTVHPTAESESSDDDFDDDGEYEEGEKINYLARAVLFCQMVITKTYELVNKLARGYLLKSLLLLGYIIYFIFAMCHEFGSEGSHRLLGCTIIGVIVLLRFKFWQAGQWVFRKCYGGKELSLEHTQKLQKCRFFLRWLMYGALTAVGVWTLIEEGRDKPENLRSLPGLFIFIVVPLLFSTRPDKINWHTIYWSLGLQFLCALFVLKWKTGEKCIVWIQDRFDEFFANTDKGAVVLFGPDFREHALIFTAFPIIFYTSGTLAILYYVGAMQVVINFIGGFLTFVLEVSPIVASSVALSIFTEAVATVLIIRPFLRRLTKSQMFTIMTACFSSLGGAYMSILSSMGVSLKFVIPAMLLSAPASIAVCKVMVPESKNRKEEDEEETLDIGAEEKKKYINILDAAQTGAISVVTVVSNMAVSAYVIYSLIGWLNTTLTWFGDRVGIDDLTIELTLSYALYPVALVMGIDPEDCKRVALLLGYRIGFVNFIAFLKLAEMKMNKFTYLQYMVATNGSGLVSHYRNDIILVQWNQTLTDGFISERSEAIITYTLCGFSSLLAVAISLGVLCALIPKRRAWLTKVAIPALVASNIANCMTGCFASIFY